MANYSLLFNKILLYKLNIEEKIQDKMLNIQFSEYLLYTHLCFKKYCKDVINSQQVIF